jgi:glycine dehydrogenase
MIASDQWSHRYSRQLAAFPTGTVRESKSWPSVDRIDNVYGDRNLFCSSAGIDSPTDPVATEQT